MCKRQELEHEKPLMDLRDARFIGGYSVGSAAKKIGIDPKDLLKYEDHPSEIPLSIAIRILKLYKVPSVDIINFKC